MRWSDWLYVRPEANPLTGRTEEVQAAVDEELAARLQERLRTRLDTGIDLRAAERAQAVRVQAEGGRLVIMEKSQDDGVRRSGAKPAPGRGRKDDKLEDLFTLGSGVPSVQRLANGDERLVFRAIREEHLFEDQDWQDHIVDRTAQDVLDESIVESYETAVRKVALEHPTDKTK